MKQIIIVLLLVIVFFIGYGQYKQYKRFKSLETTYKANEKIDLNYHNKAFLLDYYEAVETLNNYIVTQWTANEIDVLKPESDDEETKTATTEYAKKLARVKFYEAQLVESSNLKEKGLTNSDIILFEEKGITVENHQKSLKDKLVQRMYESNSNPITIGNRSALVFELQKLLTKKGFEIKIDGVFQKETFDALKSFEEKNQLYPDGKLDELTLNALLK